MSVKVQKSPIAALCVAASLALAGLAGTAGTAGQALAQSASDPLPAYVIEQFGEPPAVPTGDYAPDVFLAAEAAFFESMIQQSWGPDQEIAVGVIEQSGDPRLVWLLTDLLRFVGDVNLEDRIARAASTLLGKDVTGRDAWGTITDHMIAWDIPEPPGYLRYKRQIFMTFIPGWDQIFVEGDIDWRHVSWGGVLIDNRPFGAEQLCRNCIPAADNPAVSSAEQATWLRDDDIIFGITLNGESRAYPRQIMEVREMVNDTLGGRDLGIPYCTLCGAMQAYFTDDVPEGVERPVLRTSGLLSRSNKVMFDVHSYSVFDTFLGHAVTGPLAEIGVQLNQAPVVTTTWGQWKAAHPDTTVLIEELALGRNFDFRAGRDAQGPIFPVGDVDPRLGVQEDVIGVLNADGQAIAFPRGRAFLALDRGEPIEVEGVRLVLDAGGIRAVDAASGQDLGSHQAFWFAWSQFHPNTLLWPL